MVSWFLFAGIGTVILGLVSLIDKKILLKEHSMEFSAVFSLTNALLAFLLVPLVDFSLGVNELFLIYLISWLGALGFLFTIKAIRHMEFTSVMPLTNLNLIFIALLGVFILGEVLSLKQWLGILLLLFGGYILETRHITHYKEFLHNLKKSKGLHYLLLSFVFFSFSAIGDRYIVTRVTDSNTYLFFVLIFVAINFLLMSGAFYGNAEFLKNTFKRNWKLLALTGILTFAYRYLFVQAIALAKISLVLSLKRLSVLISILLGGELFHENNLKRKIIATLITLVGVFLIFI